MTVAESILNRASHPLLLRSIDSVFFLVEYAVLFYMLGCIFPAKTPDQSPWRNATYILAGGVLQTVSAYASGNSMFVYLAAILAGALLFTCSRRGDLLSKMTWGMLSMSLVIFAETAVIDVIMYTLLRMGRDVAPVFVSAVYFTATKLLSKALLLLMVYLIRRITKPTQFDPPILFRLSFFLIATLFLALIYLMFAVGTWGNNRSVPFLQLYIALSFLIIILIVYNLYSSFSQEYDRNLNESLVRQQLQYQKQHDEQVSELYGNMQTLRHDLKNHIACMEALLNKEDYGQLAQYFHQLQKDSASFENWIETGHPVTNAVINLKWREAMSRHVNMQVEAAIPSDIAMHATDLSAILSNLLDNAIEASAKAESPLVTLTIRPVKNYLSITVTNSTRGNVLHDNPHLETTKRDPAQMHGLGLHIVKTIVNKYSGTEIITVKDNLFEYHASLKLDQLPTGSGMEKEESASPARA